MVSVVRLARILVLALGSTFVFDALFTPPDPFTQLVFVPVLFAASLPVAYLASDDRWGLRNHGLFFLLTWGIGFAGQPLVRGLARGTAGRAAWVAVAILSAGWFTYIGPAASFFPEGTA